MTKDHARKRLARIRCVFECVESIRDGKELPDALCFVPGSVNYKFQSERTTSIVIRDSPSSSSAKIGEIPYKVSTRFTASGEEYWNDEGLWLRLVPESLKKFDVDSNHSAGWVFIHSRDNKVKDEVDLATVNSKKKSTKPVLMNWEYAVDTYYSLKISQNAETLHGQADLEAMNKLKFPPQNWSLEADEELARFISQNVTIQKEATLGNLSQYVESIEVSSQSQYISALTDGDIETYWESDGSQGQHWIRLKMKPGTVIKQLFVNVNSNDDNYMPNRFQVHGGETGNVKLLNDVAIDSSKTGDVLILEDMTQHCPIIQIWIKDCKDDGIDTRIHGIKIVSTDEKEPGLSADTFKNKTKIIRFPKLEHVNPDLLYNRARSLLRFVALLDSVLPFIFPIWKFTIGSYTSLELIRQLLPLSRRRITLIDQLILESQSCITLPSIPKVVLNRHTAAEHRENPASDPEGKQSIFCQLYEALKSEKCGVTLDFRWSNRYEQWWECKFISEGIIDQGGGFRDSLCDLAEEVCPSSADSLLPLPLFIRSPNQLYDSSNVYRDGYIPNPSCRLFDQYEWLGMLMGGHLRGRESLLLSFPKFIWKQLLGEKVSWLEDFVTVDAALVKLVESIKQMDRKKFEEKFTDILTYTAVLSNGTIVPLISNGEDEVVKYENRVEYTELLQTARMHESEEQVNAIRHGLAKVVPVSLLGLLTWQELELKVCGNPKVNVEDLRKTTYSEDLPKTDERVKYFWKAMENFSNDDRSRFLRFVTGRRRLPANMTLCAAKTTAPVDSLPEAATCSGTLFLPCYSSYTAAEEKLRYAAYNCVSIDTDGSWDE
ncbi:E3 ubiquitin- ligase HECTD3-like [Paramuricea clavata]|uniref:E3 ubiquitin- ligase HECTD3-like n=1 Tax=Paramuricea clavata TaxID=317549 RepID=A0A7D9H7X7_PARCT|nr:E3 ubiquitin- ligase HECTD3-like [Paramuricea clavata]